MITFPKNNILWVSLIIISLSLYFFLSFYLFPIIYSSQPMISRASPMILSVKILPSKVTVGNPFDLYVGATNNGYTADTQLISVSFPNLTGSLFNNEDVIIIKYHNFTQKPLFVAVGDNVGSNYSRGPKSIVAKYPSIELYNRPWKGDSRYNAEIQLKT